MKTKMIILEKLKKIEINQIKLAQQVNSLTMSLCTLSKGINNGIIASPTWINTIIESIPESLILLDNNYEIIQVNQATLKLLGYSHKELLEKKFRKLLPRKSQKTKDLIHESLNKKVEITYLDKQGRHIPVSFSSFILYNQHNEIDAIGCIAQDISEQKRIQKLFRDIKYKLNHDAKHDKLTKLPNRIFLLENLQQLVTLKSQNQEDLFAVLLLDLDNFNLVNSSLGHEIGNSLLVQVANRLKACLSQQDIITRWGADEFVIVLKDVQNLDNVIAIVERIKAQFITPFEFSNGQTTFTTISMGITLSSGKYQQAEEILRDAEIAMNQVKERGKDNYLLFNQEIYLQSVTRFQLRNSLSRGIECREFQLYYQPIVELDTMQIRGFEALIRWQHPQKGLIAPENFIPLAEETGLIFPITWWVIREACRQMRQWQQQYSLKSSLTVSVNISGRHLLEENFIEGVARILQETGLSPKCLVMELTESSLIRNPQRVNAILRQLQELGIRLSIDDFGTGYSSLSYLHTFPFNTLKIDRSFVTGIDTKPEKSRLLQTIVTLADSLGMDTVTEGVETAEQWSQIKQLGNYRHYGQGYYFSKPLPRKQAEALIIAQKDYLLSK